ncbi:MAG: hypothetical protein GY799_05670 [Desulfobulbaceae bacterium]|nr:hypothetical protein [Desulfobulbaceae bacterium]
MSTISVGRYRFQEGSVSRRDSLPSTENILQSLIGGQQVADQAGERISAGPGLSQEQKDVLETCLAGYIGPMAGIICEDHLDVVADLPAAIEALAAEISSPGHAEKFRAKVLAALGACPRMPFCPNSSEFPKNNARNIKYMAVLIL